MSSRKQAGAFFLDFKLIKIHSGSCCDIAHLSGSPVREENEEISGQL